MVHIHDASHIRLVRSTKPSNRGRCFASIGRRTIVAVAISDKLCFARTLPEASFHSRATAPFTNASQHHEHTPETLHSSQVSIQWG